MSIDQSGFGAVVAKNVIVEITDKNPLVCLANALPWNEFIEMVLPDLKVTKKCKWWMGRPLRLRIHLGAYFLQQIFGLTDRQTEYGIKEVRLVIDNGRCMTQRFIDKMPWNIKGVFLQLIEKGRKYLLDVRSFIETGSMIPDKILSFHLNEVRCITKNKPGKKYQFGRIIQLHVLQVIFYL